MCELRGCQFLTGASAVNSYEWVDDDSIAALAVPEGRGPPPQRPPAPIGPNVQDNTDGRTSQVLRAPQLPFFSVVVLSVVRSPEMSQSG